MRITKLVIFFKTGSLKVEYILRTFAVPTITTKKHTIIPINLKISGASMTLTIRNTAVSCSDAKLFRCKLFVGARGFLGIGRYMYQLLHRHMPCSCFIYKLCFRNYMYKACMRLLCRYLIVYNNLKVPINIFVKKKIK